MEPAEPSFLRPDWGFGRGAGAEAEGGAEQPSLGMCARKGPCPGRARGRGSVPVLAASYWVGDCPSNRGRNTVVPCRFGKLGPFSGAQVPLFAVGMGMQRHVSSTGLSLPAMAIAGPLFFPVVNFRRATGPMAGRAAASCGFPHRAFMPGLGALRRILIHFRGDRHGPLRVSAIQALHGPDPVLLPRPVTLDGTDGVCGGFRPARRGGPFSTRLKRPLIMINCHMYTSNATQLGQPSP